MSRTRAANGEAFREADKVRFCAEVADGMNALSAQFFVHRDLAARNVLLGSGMVCKVADFGLSRGVQAVDDGNADSENYYRSERGCFPVKWTPPEGPCTSGTTTTKTEHV